jgi:hypothetical protein
LTQTLDLLHYQILPFRATAAHFLENGSIYLLGLEDGVLAFLAGFHFDCFICLWRDHIDYLFIFSNVFRQEKRLPKY